MQPDPGAQQPQQEIAQLQITEEDLVDSAPRVRALMVARLEQLWQPVQARLALDAGGEMPIDPRLLEIGLRVVKEEATLYRLFRAPAAGGGEEEEDMGPGVDRAALIEAKLQEIEERVKGDS